ncbi:hypothetical protein CVT25_000093 [Psilocybe cyanescens]|uniref:Uncharacterized protein n=1 Tax=Psilocybe cyanescens TaxID=93625 RepID=A0A409XKG7_PSICY|nr:hypothetical protein CVT25_000093 [Psilocybe cyanescens]
MESAIQISNINEVLEDKLIAPTGTAPSPLVFAADADATEIALYQALYQVYQHKVDRFPRAQKDYTKANSWAKGILSVTLWDNIYEEIMSMTAHEAWVWLATTYATEQFVKTLDTFKKL